MATTYPVSHNLSLQDEGRPQSVVVLGEVLWDVFEDSRRLGGAALNFAAHARRLGHPAALISAVGDDALGQEALAQIGALELDTAFIQTTARFPTGAARVQLGPAGRTRFVIERPAAYDAVELSVKTVEQLIRRTPDWFYYGTLFSSVSGAEPVLMRLLDALPGATRFYDLNLRPGCHSPALVIQLLSLADVVKLNEDELEAVHEMAALPAEAEAFCREGAERFGWKAACITLGERGCALMAGGEFVEVSGRVVEVIDTVGAGDAFAAAFMHGLSAEWPATRIASFANSVGALVASRHGAIPEWTLEEAVQL